MCRDELSAVIAQLMPHLDIQAGEAGRSGREEKKK